MYPEGEVGEALIREVGVTCAVEAVEDLALQAVVLYLDEAEDYLEDEVWEISEVEVWEMF